MFTISYNGINERYSGYTRREAVKIFREKHGLKNKRLNGKLAVYIDHGGVRLQFVHHE